MTNAFDTRTYDQCRACGKPLTGRRTTDPHASGRRREYCDSGCRKDGQRRRQRDPEGWEADQKARDRRAKARQRKLDKDAREWEEEMAAFQLGADRMARMSEAEFRAKLAGLSRSERDEGERLLADSKIRGLLLLALGTDSEDEAMAALAAARRRHVTNGS